MAGLLGAGLLGAAAWAAGVVSSLAIGVVAVAGLAGSLAESLVQDLAGERGARLDHEFANAFNTFVGALVALELAASLEQGGLFLPLAGP
jgi:uncharacterized membrane protein